VEIRKDEKGKRRMEIKNEGEEGGRSEGKLTGRKDGY
jgi:hypothetical protein